MKSSYTSEIEQTIVQFLKDFHANSLIEQEKIDNALSSKKKSSSTKDSTKKFAHRKAIFLYGEAGIGKTTFIQSILSTQQYHTIYTHAGDLRNKSFVKEFTTKNMSKTSLVSNDIAIVLDNIENMNNGDKLGINTLITIVRPKHTKSQMKDDTTCNPIICICNTAIDKKIQELKKVSIVVEMPKPPIEEIARHLNEQTNHVLEGMDTEFYRDTLTYIDNNWRKCANVVKYFHTFKDLKMFRSAMSQLFTTKHFENNTKRTTLYLLKNAELNSAMNWMDEKEKIVVSLMFHENMIDANTLSNGGHNTQRMYLDILDLIKRGDVLDTIFLKNSNEIILNQISFYLKCILPHRIFHQESKMYPIVGLPESSSDLRFTKALTKKRTKFNNNEFVNSICQKLFFGRKTIYDMTMKGEIDSHMLSRLTDRSSTSETKKIDLELKRIHKFVQFRQHPSIGSIVDHESIENECSDIDE